MLVEIHLIQNHAPSNLNRDDTGSPKEALFGGFPRARISSQCIKRSIRQSEIFQQALKGHLATRTRRLPEQLKAPLMELGASDTEVADITRKASGFGSDKENNDLETRQLIFFGDDEAKVLADALLKRYREDPGAFNKAKPEDLAKELAEKLAKELGASLPRSVDIALFGRMTTSALFEDVQASLQVAHAIGTTRLERQFDYFTAVDDLAEESDERGAGMIGDVEFNSATYYKYFSLHWEDLVKNLGGDVETAGKTVEALLWAAALVTPTGKQNTFAAHNPPDAIYVEVKDVNIPISYANAFVKPVRPREHQDVVELSIQALVDYVGQVHRVYYLGQPRAVWCCTREIEMPGAMPARNLREVAGLVLGALGAPGEGR